MGEAHDDSWGGRRLVLPTLVLGDVGSRPCYPPVPPRPVARVSPVPSPVCPPGSKRARSARVWGAPRSPGAGEGGASMLEDHAHEPAASHPVVVGIDGSTGGWDALAWAAVEARATGRPLHIVHVVEWPILADLWPVPLLDRVVSLRSAGADLLEDGAKRAREVVPHLAVAMQLAVDADVGDALVRVAADASMLVLGKRRGARPWWRRGRRRIAVAAARRSRCPVAVVELRSQPGGALTGWVVVLDDSP